MTLLEYALENAPINERPECPECSALMYLAVIEPGRPGFDLRTFKCPRCQQVESVVAAFQTGAVKYTNGR
jgi:DNA-directed RNA polymerase subunit M/transcription elongation factor TFIIS